jgi:anti-sigma factor RsiW
MRQHVDDRLAPFCDGTLPAPEASEVAEHLAGCARCEELRAEVERGLAALRELRRESLPEARASEVRALLSRSAGRQAALRRVRLVGMAAVLLAVVAGGLAIRLFRPALRLDPSRGALTGIERAALELRRQAATGELALDLPSHSPEVVRQWVQERSGLSVNLAGARPAEDAGRFELLGAKQTAIGAAPAVAVAYRIDGAAAVLLTAEASAVADRPQAWRAAGKTVRHAQDPASGANILTWTNSGQVYSLASALPRGGVAGCYVCHTDAHRRREIERIAAGL